MLNYNDIKVGSILMRHAKFGTELKILILATPSTSIISGYYISQIMHLTKDKYGLIQDKYVLYSENWKQEHYWNVLC